MTEQICETLRMLLFTKLPKNLEGRCVVYDSPIKKFYIGDVTLGAIDTPAAVIFGENSPPVDYLQGTQKYDHRITIKCIVKEDSKESADRNINEFVRLVNSVLIQSRRLWVVTKCPFCLKDMLSPEHFIIEHNDVLSSFATTVTNEFNAIWALTSTSPAPTPPASGVAAEAFLRLYETLRSNPNASVTNLLDPARNHIKDYIRDSVIPIRLMYDAKVTDIKPTDGGREQAGVYTGVITFSLTELMHTTSYGPDNVDTGAWE